MRPAWVYGLRDPRDGLVWYVGRSARPRARVHLGAELRAALDARAEEERRTVRAVVEAALSAYLQTPVRP